MYLTNNQRRILRLLRDGHTYASAAKTLGITVGGMSAAINRAAGHNGYKSFTEVRRAVEFACLEERPQIRRLAGVRQTKSGNYRASISVGKYRQVSIGTYPTREQAIAARLEAEKKYRGA